MSKIKLALEVVEDLKSLAASIETLVNAMETNEKASTNESADETSKKKSKVKAKPEEIIEPEVKQPTLEEVRVAMADKSRDGHRDAVKAIITKYGANNLSSLDSKYYSAALKEVGEIK